MKTLSSSMGALAALAAGLWAQQAPPPPPEAGQVAIRAQPRLKAMAGPTFGFVSAEMISGKVVTGAPYSAEAVTETTQVLADGNHISNRMSSMIYRDSDGRERREQTLNAIGPWAAGEPVKLVTISDPVAKVNYTLDPNTHTARKMPRGVVRWKTGSRAGVSVSGPVSGAFSTVAASTGKGGAMGVQVVSIGAGSDFKEATTGAKTESLGKMVIEGVEAEGARTTLTIPAGQIGNELPIEIVSERWYSPELQTVVMSKHRDPRTGETVYRLTNIDRTEPLHSLFEVPPDYKVTAEPQFWFSTAPKKEE